MYEKERMGERGKGKDVLKWEAVESKRRMGGRKK